METELISNDVGDTNCAITIEDCNEENTQNVDEGSMTSETARSKRGREEDLEEWTQVKSRRDRLREVRGIVEICITSKETLPKQFALAKLFKAENISNITRVRYINPYKIVVEINGEENVVNLLHCERLLQLGWRFQRSLEVGLSYGVIKNIELDLSEEDLLKSISCSNELVNVKRLKRRTVEGIGWTESESVRVGFAGPSLPSYIYIYDMQVKVEPYIFPVTQCSRCWRFGHTVRMCPSKRVFCPKCGGKHENCSTTAFKCINCSKDHMSLNRKCPEYLKEKRIREIMAEFNVSYRKAVTMYVPPLTPLHEPTHSPIRNVTKDNSASVPTILQFNNVQGPNGKRTYAQAVSSSSPLQSSKINKPVEICNQKNQPKKKKKGKGQNQTQEGDRIDEEMNSTDTENSNNNFGESKNHEGSRESYNRPFYMFLRDIKNIFFQKNTTLKCRIEKVVQLVFEWAIAWILQNLQNVPFFSCSFN